MRISVGFLLATFAATGLTAPTATSARLDARMMIPTPGQTPDTSNWGSGTGSDSHTITGNDLLADSPTNIDSPGPMIPPGSVPSSGKAPWNNGPHIPELTGWNQGSPSVTTTGNDLLNNSPTTFDDTPGPLVRTPTTPTRNPSVVSTGPAISRLPDGTIINIDPTSPRPAFFPNNIVPTRFSDFNQFHYTLQYTQRSFLSVVSQWQTQGFSATLVRSQFSTWTDNMFRILSLFQGGCGTSICNPLYAGQFQTLATDMLRDIQYALQIIQVRYGSLWGQFTDEFRTLQNIIRVIFGLAASFGIQIGSWFNTINLNVNLFQSIDIHVNRFVRAPPSVLLNLNQQL